MKKILLSISVVAIAVVSVQAQQKQQISISPSLGRGEIDKSISREVFQIPKTKTRGGSTYLRYVDYIGAQENIPSATLDATGGVSYVFPDSNVRYGAPNSAFGIGDKAIGQVLDPRAATIRDNTPPGSIVFGPGDAYTVDSIFIGLSYVKKYAADDTLILSFVHSGGTNLPMYSYSGQLASYGVDTTRALFMEYNPLAPLTKPIAQMAAGGPAAVVIKHVLTSADSVTFTPPNTYGTKFIKVPVNFSVPAGERVSVSASFAPGFSYAVGDTISNNNRLLYVSYQPKGASTFMPYYPGDLNMSHTVYKDTSKYYGLFVPTLAWLGASFDSQVHDMVWRLTCPTCFPEAVKNLQDNGIAVKVTPNPASEYTNLSISLNESANNVSVSFTNALGQIVKTQNMGSLSANTAHALNVKVSDLAKGLYIYTVNADGKKYSNKLMVN